MTKKQTKPQPKATIRQQVDKQIENRQIMTSAIDLSTLKRMYPKRFLDDILQNEGYVKEGNKYKKT